MTHTDRHSGSKSPSRGDFAQNSHRRTIFLTAAAVFLCSLLFCGAAAAADQAPFPDTGILESTTYTLTGDVMLSADVSVPDGVSCTIDLNGYVLKGTGSGPVITVESGGCLTLDDTSAEKTGKVTGGSAAYGGGVFVVGGTFTMNGGCITENTALTNGGGVSVGDGSLFTLNGGRISGNTAEFGGGVFAYNSTFKMKGGYIEENNAETGAGGVCVRDGPFIMEGGYITGNHAPFCGGVYIHSVSTFTMDDGYITGNRADEIGGGGVLITDASFVMNGGAISQNSAKYGGGVFADAGSCTLSGEQLPKTVQNTEEECTPSATVHFPCQKEPSHGIWSPVRWSWEREYTFRTPGSPWKAEASQKTLQTAQILQGAVCLSMKQAHLP